jgi:hypothetical protein
MARLLHGSARTTPCASRAPEVEREHRALAIRYQLNPKTVAKWHARQATADAPMGPAAPHSTVLTPAEEAIIVIFRRRTLLPLDDVMGCLTDSIPNLTRSELHRCLQRHGISRLPASDEKASKRGHFAETNIGYVHIDSCELRIAEGKLIIFLAIDRLSKFVHVEIHESVGKMQSAAFPRSVVATFPYRLHAVLTDNGMAFVDLPKNRGRRPEIEAIFGGHIFDRVCNSTRSPTSSPSRITPGPTARPNA